MDMGHGHGTWGLRDGDMSINMVTWGHEVYRGDGGMPHLDHLPQKGAWGLGTWGHGAYRPPTQKSVIGFRVYMGTWLVGSLDQEELHTFSLGPGDMRTLREKRHVGTWDSGDMGP